MYAYDCWNEVHIEPAWPRNMWIQPQGRIYCYCDQTIQMFRRWLESRYATLDALNEACGQPLPPLPGASAPKPAPKPAAKPAPAMH